MKRLFATRENQMKKWLAIVGFCVFLIPCAYGETINYDSGDKYVGEVSNGVAHGQGTYTWADGEKYVGEWKEGLRHGQGTYFYGDEAKYVGEWKEGLRHGQAIYFHANGAKYVGEYKDGTRWAGIFYKDDGTVLGNYIEGVYQSEGFECVKRREYIEDGKNMIDCEFYDGERYVGGYEEGMWNGHGTGFYPDGSKYVGEWKDGLKHGQGTYTWTDGSKYAGELKDGGQWNGIAYNADGTVLGTYSNGVLIPK